MASRIGLASGVVLALLAGGPGARAGEGVLWPDGRILPDAYVFSPDLAFPLPGYVVRFDPGERLVRIEDEVFVAGPATAGVRRAGHWRAAAGRSQHVVRHHVYRRAYRVVFCRPAAFDYCGRI